jgi:hypothetical protein
VADNLYFEDGAVEYHLYEISPGLGDGDGTLFL